MQILVNQKPRMFASSCGAKHEKTKRLCGCGPRKSSRTFHTVYNVQPSR
jgi:hypothetical protein